MSTSRERYYTVLFLYLRITLLCITIFGTFMVLLTVIDTVFKTDWGLQGWATILVSALFIVLGFLLYVIFTVMDRKLIRKN